MFDSGSMLPNTALVPGHSTRFQNVASLFLHFGHGFVSRFLSRVIHGTLWKAGLFLRRFQDFDVTLDDRDSVGQIADCLAVSANTRLEFVNEKAQTMVGAPFALLPVVRNLLQGLPSNVSR